MNETLSENERILLNIIQEYLNKNRWFNVKKIIPFINSRFKLSGININREGIETILKSLVNKKLIVEGSKLTKDMVLLNITRENIFNYIKKNPGCFFLKIVKELNLPYNVVIWHLEILTEFQFVKKEAYESHEIYFDFNLDLKRAKKNFLAFNEKSKKIIEYLNKIDEGITKNQLASELKMHLNTVSKYLEELLISDIIIKESRSNKTFYFLKEKSS